MVLRKEQKEEGSDPGLGSSSSNIVTPCHRRVTHCGWNSTIEAITAGVPLITWPLFGDRFCDEKLAVQLLHTGVSIGVEEAITWGDEARRERLLKVDGSRRGRGRETKKSQKACRNGKEGP
ncbi:hypothetical protein PTKIN_Ptkin01aG0298200 [Pterospermum kingtungense]